MIIDEHLANIATGREQSFFASDLSDHMPAIRAFYRGKRVLIIGGAGTIGTACTLQILKFEPQRLDVVDLNENGLANLARHIRSENLAPNSELTFNALDFAGYPMRQLMRDAGPWDICLNFAAVKHVRSEKNVACALHMLDVNAVKQFEFLKLLFSLQYEIDYFVVSTDKAADPGNLMGASKRLLEFMLFGVSGAVSSVKISSARFANVAFSAGSLLESFKVRLEAGQALACPSDTRRYFISPTEASEICIIGQVFAPAKSIVVPKMNPEEHLVSLEKIATKFLKGHGKEPFYLDEKQSRGFDASGNQYPLIMSPRDTAGEKECELFVGTDEREIELNLKTIRGVIPFVPSPDVAETCYAELKALTSGGTSPVTRDMIDALVSKFLHNYSYVAGNAKLDNRV